MLDKNGVMVRHGGVIMGHLVASLGFMGSHGGLLGTPGGLHGATMALDWKGFESGGSGKSSPSRGVNPAYLYIRHAWLDPPPLEMFEFIWFSLSQMNKWACLKNANLVILDVFLTRPTAQV